MYNRKIEKMPVAIIILLFYKCWRIFFIFFASNKQVTCLLSNPRFAKSSTARLGLSKIFQYQKLNIDMRIGL